MFWLYLFSVFYSLSLLIKSSMPKDAPTILLYVHLLNEFKKSLRQTIFYLYVILLALKSLLVQRKIKYSENFNAIGKKTRIEFENFYGF